MPRRPLLFAAFTVALFMAVAHVASAQYTEPGPTGGGSCKPVNPEPGLTIAGTFSGWTSGWSQHRGPLAIARWPIRDWFGPSADQARPFLWRRAR